MSWNQLVYPSGVHQLSTSIIEAEGERRKEEREWVLRDRWEAMGDYSEKEVRKEKDPSKGGGTESEREQRREERWRKGEKREGETGRGRRINKYDCTLGANIWLDV